MGLSSASRNYVARESAGSDTSGGNRRKLPVALAFLAPSLGLLLAFCIGPMLGTVWVSLQDWNLIGVPTFVGHDNHAELAQDRDFHSALWHTLGFLMGYLPLVLIFGPGVALLPDAKLPAMTLYRATFFLPVISSWVAISLLWKWPLNPADRYLGDTFYGGGEWLILTAWLGWYEARTGRKAAACT